MKEKVQECPPVKGIDIDDLNADFKDIIKALSSYPEEYKHQLKNLKAKSTDSKNPSWDNWEAVDEFHLEVYSDGDWTNVSVVYFRDETDEEQAARQKRELERQIKEEQAREEKRKTDEIKERELYEQLKKKYEK